MSQFIKTSFTIPPTGMTYLQLSATRIYVRAKIAQENGGNIIADDEGKGSAQMQAIQSYVIKIQYQFKHF